MAKKKGKQPPMPPDTPLAAAAARRHELTRARAIQALRELDRAGTPVTFAAVAATAGISRSWLYTQPDIRTQLEQLRKATQDAPGPAIPASQRASDPSLRSRLATALQRNRALAGENARLRRQLARTLGDQRSAQPQSGNDRPRLNRHDHGAPVSSKTPSTTRNRRSQLRSCRGLKIRLGTTGGFGVLLLLAVTSFAVLRFFGRNPQHAEGTWARRAAPALATILLAGIVVLAVWHYNLLLGVAPGAAVSWAFPAGYAVVAAGGTGWGLVLRARRPQAFAAVGLGASAVTGQATPTVGAPR
jgi:hypothetical protein